MSVLYAFDEKEKVASSTICSRFVGPGSSKDPTKSHQPWMVSEKIDIFSTCACYSVHLYWQCAEKRVRSI